MRRMVSLLIGCRNAFDLHILDPALQRVARDDKKRVQNVLILFLFVRGSHSPHSVLTFIHPQMND